MTFLQALYGSQYQEITQKGGDGSKGRINANMFLSAFMVLLIIVLTSSLAKISSAASVSFLNNLLNDNSIVSGKLIGKLLTVPLFIAVYFIVCKTIGKTESYNRIIEKISQLPEDIKKTANDKIIIPFFILLVLLIVLIITS